MSINVYNDSSGELTCLANGQRTWVGTKAAHAAARQAGTLPRDALIAIVDDDDEYKTDQVIEDSQMVITSGGVYDALPKENVLTTEVTFAAINTKYDLVTSKSIDNKIIILEFESVSGSPNDSRRSAVVTSTLGNTAYFYVYEQIANTMLMGLITLSTGKIELFSGSLPTGNRPFKLIGVYLLN